jgi:hypothetical protein
MSTIIIAVYEALKAPVLPKIRLFGQLQPFLNPILPVKKMFSAWKKE